MIRSEEISVVIQGAVSNYTHKCIHSIRIYLPKSEIILSTWKWCDISDLDFDVLVLNQDPGAEVYTRRGDIQNQNRQILSTVNGIKKATRKYVLKLRSDIKLTGINFLGFYNLYTKRSSKYILLKNRVLINSLYTRRSLYYKRKNNTTTFIPFLFHPSDWVMFGLKDDLFNIWNIPLAEEPKTSNFFINNPNSAYIQGCYTRWHAEQYIWVSFLQKNGVKINFDNYLSYSDDLKYISELSIVNNLVVLDYKRQFDILCLKYPSFFGDGSKTMHNIDWQIMYNKYCNGNLKLAKFDIFWNKVLFSQYRVKLYVNLCKFLSPFWEILKLKWLVNFFLFFKYLVKYIFYVFKCLRIFSGKS